jgi:CRISPR-associated protein Cas4
MSDTFITATLYKRFLLCPKQAAFSLDKAHDHLSKTTPGAALGRAAHKIVEMSMYLSPDLSEADLMLWFDSSWEDLVKIEYSKMQNEWAPNFALDYKSWRGFFKAKYAAKTLVTKNSGLLPMKRVKDPNVRIEGNNETTLTLPAVEEYLSSEELGIKGILDYIFNDDGKVTIFDYKFGKDQLILENHRLQMHFYLLLVEVVSNLKVERMAIVSSSNLVCDVPIDRVYAQELLSDIKRVKKALVSNSVIAMPSASNCQFCPYKSLCPQFKSAKLKTQSGNPMSITGVVGKINQIDEHFQEVQIEEEVIPKRVIRIFGVPWQYSIQLGSNIQVMDNLHFHSESLIEFQWNSRLFQEQ